MSVIRSPMSTVVLAAAVLIGAANVGAYATSGHSLLAGRNNAETRATAVDRTTKGAALRLHTHPGSPPLRVSSSGWVHHLNADMVDGMQGAQLVRRSKTEAHAAAAGYDADTTAYVDNDSDVLYDEDSYWHVNLAPGTWRIAYSAGLLPTNNPNTASCGLIQVHGTGSVWRALSVAPYQSPWSRVWLSGETTVHFDTAGTVILKCGVASGTFVIDSLEGLRVEVTPVDQVTETPLQTGQSGAARRPLARNAPSNR